MVEQLRFYDACWRFSAMTNLKKWQKKEKICAHLMVSDGQICPELLLSLGPKIITTQSNGTCACAVASNFVLRNFFKPLWVIPLNILLFKPTLFPTWRQREANQWNISALHTLETVLAFCLKWSRVHSLNKLAIWLTTLKQRYVVFRP